MRLQLRNYIWIYSNQLFLCLKIKIQNKFVTYLYTFYFFVNFIILQNTKKTISVLKVYSAENGFTT